MAAISRNKLNNNAKADLPKVSFIKSDRIYKNLKTAFFENAHLFGKKIEGDIFSSIVNLIVETVGGIKRPYAQIMAICSAWGSREFTGSECLRLCKFLSVTYDQWLNGHTPYVPDGTLKPQGWTLVHVGHVEKCANNLKLDLSVVWGPWIDYKFHLMDKQGSNRMRGLLYRTNITTRRYKLGHPVELTGLYFFADMLEDSNNFFRIEVTSNLDKRNKELIKTRRDQGQVLQMIRDYKDSGNADAPIITSS